jgi:hypothetical protein
MVYSVICDSITKTSQKMKNMIRVTGLTVLLAVAVNTHSQSVVVVANYMKVQPGMEQAYLDAEKQWKQVHERTIEDGIKIGWQLWRKHYTGTADEYDYITLDWFVDFKSTLNPYPTEMVADMFSGRDWETLQEITEAARHLVRRQVSHEILSAENSKGAKYLVVNRMHVEEENVNAYVSLEDNIWRPYHEVCIEAGFRTHWGLWRDWPFDEGQTIFTAVDGFDDPAQIMSGEDLLSKVHPDMTWDEIDEQTNRVRHVASVEIWELVDSIFLEEE